MDIIISNSNDWRHIFWKEKENIALFKNQKKISIIEKNVSITMDKQIERTFMEEIQQYPCLYEKFNKSYKKQVHSNEWLEIGCKQV